MPFAIKRRDLMLGLTGLAGCVASPPLNTPAVVTPTTAVAPRLTGDIIAVLVGDTTDHTTLGDGIGPGVINNLAMVRGMTSGQPPAETCVSAKFAVPPIRQPMISPVVR